MELSELEKIRLKKVFELRNNGIEPYPTRANPTHSSQEAIAAFEAAERQATSAPVEVTLAGRLRAIRPMGKVIFAHIEDGAGRIQLFFRVNELGEEQIRHFVDYYDLGDFVEASGVMFRTRTGEVTLHVHRFRMLAKAISPLPAAKDEVVDGQVIRHATLSDPELRYRQRYADLAVNPEVREIFRKRAAIVRALREFLDQRGFLEVETPILQPIYGGAAARPFVTYHNQLKQQLYLRISFELYLKRLLVGGYERVYEIGRDFRNEGVSFKHNPEFTQLEFYMAYADYLKVMTLAEEMLAYVCDRVLGTRQVTFNGHVIDFNPPWRRISLREALIEAVGIDIAQHPTTESLAEAMRQKGLAVKPNAPRGKLIEGLLGDFVEPNLIQPTFVYDYPRDISPLAKNKPEDPDTVERFEGYVGGMELCNAFTELNDPLEQEKRFLEMGRTYEADDEDRHPMDEDYLRAMAYGMPPNGGFGMGIDRLVMLLTDRRSIREVILFPHLREREVE
ncbi:lysine--tRNA ligase [uncultured Thermanaerothrix sp.]|uniref:lysine--tRNA ligase n=1 Tax=uncultured Thermanaerothrix sp. TaxID=1195149 RepID=UPI00262E0E62|nr:lysine--tRNA ligase [uncultured Thermanaerothrix sp.]